MSRGSRPAAGFTLIEVLAVVLLTSLVMGIALDFYTDLTKASNRATEHTRELRRATAILDRVARDLQGAIMIVKPPELDPNFHPWIFVAEARDSQLGSDHVKFVTRANRPRSQKAHESDLAVVAYMARETEDGTLQLLRWTSPLPEYADRDFPFEDDPGITLLADGIDAFGMHFLDDEAEWSETWDSTLLLDSSELPLAVDVQVSIANEAARDVDELAFEDDDANVHSRIVVLPLRPLDLQALLDPLGAGLAEDGDEEGEDGEGDDGEGDGTVRNLAQCLGSPTAFAGSMLENYYQKHKYDIVDAGVRSGLAAIRFPDGSTALDQLKPECQ